MDKLGEVPMSLFVEMLGIDISKLILSFAVVDADSSFLNLFLDEEDPQSNVLYSRAMALLAGDVKSRGVVDVHEYVIEVCAESQLFHHVGAKHRLFYCQYGGHELCLHGRLYRQLLQPHLDANQAVGNKR